MTMRNQTAVEITAGVNSANRSMQVDLSTSIDLAQSEDTYLTFLVRENTASLTAAQLASNKRNLTLNFLSGNGTIQYDLALKGSNHTFGIDSVADTAGQDVAAGGFASDTTYLFLAKISGNGEGANTIQASLLPSGSVVPDFTQPEFQWMLTALGGAGFNPVITDLQFISQAEANYTVSNVWVGNAATMLPATLTSQGDFNRDGVVDSADYVVWRSSMGQTGAGLSADGNGDNQVNETDINVWRRNFGRAVVAGSLAAAAGVPEPGLIGLLLTSAAALGGLRPKRHWKRRIAVVS